MKIFQLGRGQTIQHFWSSTLLISALLSRNKGVVRKDISVAPTVSYSLTPALPFTVKSSFSLFSFHGESSFLLQFGQK